MYTDVDRDRVIAAAADLAGDTARASIWYESTPIPGWAGKTAKVLVGEGKGQKVLDYIEAVKAGVFA